MPHLWLAGGLYHAIHITRGILDRNITVLYMCTKFPVLPDSSYYLSTRQCNLRTGAYKKLRRALDSLTYCNSDELINLNYDLNTIRYSRINNFPASISEAEIKFGRDRYLHFKSWFGTRIEGEGTEGGHSKSQPSVLRERKGDGLTRRKDGKIWLGREVTGYERPPVTFEKLLRGKTWKSDVKVRRVIVKKHNQSLNPPFRI